MAASDRFTTHAASAGHLLGMITAKHEFQVTFHNGAFVRFEPLLKDMWEASASCPWAHALLQQPQAPNTTAPRLGRGVTSSAPVPMVVPEARVASVFKLLAERYVCDATDLDLMNDADDPDYEPSQDGSYDSTPCSSPDVIQCHTRAHMYDRKGRS
jgi:hypothetical protein